MAVFRCPVAVGLFLLAACSPSEPPQTATTPPQEVSVPEPTPTGPTPTPPSADADRIEALALKCDGAALMTIGATSVAGIEAGEEHASARLLARWEQSRAFEDGSIVAKSVDAFVPSLASALGTAPPQWWVDTLKSGRGGDGIATGYDLQPTTERDRRGALTPGPGGVLLRSAFPLVESNGMLAYDLSMGRVELMPLPEHKGTAVEVTRAHAGTTLYVAAFEPGAGGFRFPLRAINSDGTERWSTEVCASDRQVLGGVGYMIVEVVVIEDPPPKRGTKSPSRPRAIAVFTAESHGVTVERFDLQGLRTLAWSSDLWSWRG